MIFRLFLIATLALSSFFLANAQYRPPSQGSPLDKFYFGGGGSLGGGTGTFNISVSPLIGYKITDDFSVGLQLTYQYYQEKYRNPSITYKVSNYGGGPFIRYNITQNLFGYTQYEYLNIGLRVAGEEIRRDYSSMFVGGGYSVPIGNGKLAFNVLALYNIFYGDGLDSPYASPLQFRMGIVAGL